jgi:serine/threonine protein kinase
VCTALNYETQQVFAEYANAQRLQLPNSGYVRQVLFHTLLHNSREDYVNRIMRKLMQKVSTKDEKAFSERPRFQEKPKSKKVPEMFLMPPSKVGPADFRGVAQLGRGSFGEVYLVEKIDTGEQYALKVLKKEKVLGNNLVRYAFTERNILLHISHPFIVKLNYAFQTPEKLVMVMDYCPNGDLGTHLTREKKFTEDKARFYMAEIALALGELHRNNILFRDLKPENVVLDKDGNARLTDFGLSKEGVTDEQLSKSFCGSIAYLAPEMLKRSGHTRSVDWYLLGVLSYEMVCGTPPFYSPNREQMFNNIQRAELKFPPYLSNECRGLIKELMNREPSKRLGAGKRDFDEVREHAFFAEMNWEALLNKEIPPPPVKPVRRAPKTVSLEKMFGKLEVEQKARVDGWSVLTPSKK